MAIKKFWQFQNKSDNSAELYLYGDISESTWYGDEVTAKQFAADLKSLGDVEDITVRINSGGGDVFAAQAIGNMLESNKAKVTAKIDGLCASAATIVACHCDRVMAALDSTYMIHPVKMGLFGFADSEVLQQYIDALRVIRDNIVSLYAKKTGREKDEVAAQMDATTWMTGEEAMLNGFVDELIEDEETVVDNRGGLLFVNGVGTHFPYNDLPQFLKRCPENGTVKPNGEVGADGAAKPYETISTIPTTKADTNLRQNTEVVRSTAEGFVDKSINPAVPETTNHKEVESMEISTVDELREAFPELVGQIEATAAENATAAERQRIKDISEMSLAGNESSACDAMFNTPMSAADFAMQSVKNAKAAEESQKQAYLNSVREDVANSGMDKVNHEEASNEHSDEFMDAIKSLAQ